MATKRRARGACKSRDVAREDVPGAWQRGSSMSQSSPCRIGCCNVALSTKHTRWPFEIVRRDHSSPGREGSGDRPASISLCPVPPYSHPLSCCRVQQSELGVWRTALVGYARLRARVMYLPPRFARIPRFPAFRRCVHGALAQHSFSLSPLPQNSHDRQTNDSARFLFSFTGSHDDAQANRG
jgi:hypothetical protein